MAQVIAKLDSTDRRKKQPSPRDAVGTSLAAAFQAAADAASSLAAPVVNNFYSFTSAAVASLPVQVMATQLQGAALAGHSTAVASMAMVSCPAPYSSRLHPTARPDCVLCSKLTQAG